MRKLCPGECRLWQEMRGRPGGKTDPERYLILASDAEGQVSSGEMRYVFRYFLWAEDVEVGDIREPEAWEAEIREGKYDRIFWMPGEP